MKPCKICLQDKPESDYRIITNTKGDATISKTCRHCENVKAKARYWKKQGREQPTGNTMIGAKECKACGNVKPIDAFPVSSCHRDGHRNICRECRLAKQREYDMNKRDKELQERPFFPQVERISIGGIAI